MNKILIGIDPGVNNGIAIYKVDGTTKSLSLYTEDFWETINTIVALNKIQGSLEVHIECPYLNKGIFRSRLATSKSPNMDLHIAESVGANKQTAKLLVDFCKSRDIPVHEIRPTKKKKNSEEFKAITGIPRSSQHGRDAAMILINQNLTHYQNEKTNLDPDTIGM